MTMKPLQMWVVMSLQDHTGNSSHILHNLLNLFSNIFITLNWYYHLCCCYCNCDECDSFLESSSLISKGQHCILKNITSQLVLGYLHWVLQCISHRYFIYVWAVEQVLCTRLGVLRFHLCVFTYQCNILSLCYRTFPPNVKKYKFKTRTQVFLSKSVKCYSTFYGL